MEEGGQEKGKEKQRDLFKFPKNTMLRICLFYYIEKSSLGGARVKPH